MAVDSEKIQNFLSEQRSEAPEEFLQTFLDIEEYWDRKLWHQLTDVLLAYFSEPKSAPQRLPLFRQFIVTFADKINQLKFVSLAIQAATQCSDNDERLGFYRTLTKKVDRDWSQDAFVYALVQGAEVKLRTEDNEGTRKDLDRAQSILDSFDTVETEVHAAFYRVNARYYQVTGDYAAFYKNALLYLACIDVKSLSKKEAQTRARDLSIAALASDSIYNFGELLLHPILDSLRGSDFAWLRDMLFAFNRGDIAAFKALESRLEPLDVLADNKPFLYQKIHLSALTEAVFRRPPHDRAMTFDTIAHETGVQPKDIELLVMKALSLGLLRGSIDQVTEVARINWVQPKVLDMKQIDNMRGRLNEWDSSVNQLGHWIEGVGKDVWAA